MTAPQRRFWIAGIPVDVLSEREIVTLLERTVERRERIVLANANLHGLHEALGDRVMLALLQAPDTVVHIDGMPILWAARLARVPVPDQARNTHIDLIPKMLARCAANGWPVAIVGGDPALAKDNERVLGDLVPGLNVTAFDGYFDLADDGPGSKQAGMIEALNALRPALLLVGMGMPRQERWIAANRARLNAAMIMPVGGFADYFAGRTKMPPRIFGRIGAEWLFRLVADPRRLAFRYLVEPALMSGRIARATLKGARWGREQAD